MADYWEAQSILLSQSPSAGTIGTCLNGQASMWVLQMSSDPHTTWQTL